MEKIPPKTDFPQFDLAPEIDFADHRKAAGREMLAEPIWKIKLWLSGLPPEDYELRREHIAAGLNITPEELDKWRNLSFDEKATLITSLTDEEYESERTALSERFGLRLTVLDGWRREAKASQQDKKPKAPERENKGQAVSWPEPEPWPEPVNGADLLDRVVEVISTYVSLSDNQASTIALWSIMTWLHDDLEVSAFLNVTSATKRCGKSLLATEVVPTFLHRPLAASGQITEAVLFRIVEQHSPALVVDEVDTFLRTSPELRGLINGSHRKDGAYTFRCEGDYNEVRRFRTFSPKLLAGIGKLEDTTADRTIRITLVRRPPGGNPLPLWRDRPHEQITILQRKIARWIGDNRKAILQDRGEVAFPPTLDDRQRDCWEALLAIANKAGGLWPKRAYAAAEELSQSDIDEDSARELLIHHIRDVFEAKENPAAIHSKELLVHLIAIEASPWTDWRQGRPLSARELSSLLRDFGIKSQQVKLDSVNRFGYRFSDFEDTWKAYSQKKGGVPHILSTTPLPSSAHAGFSDSKTLPLESEVVDRNPLKASVHATSSGVVDRKGGEGGTEKEMNLFDDFADPSRESDGHGLVVCGFHLPPLPPGQKDSSLRRLLIELEGQISCGVMTLSETRPYVLEFLADTIKPPFLNRWWTRPAKDLSEAQRQQLAAGGLLPPGIFEAEAWEDSTEADPEDIIH